MKIDDLKDVLKQCEKITSNIDSKNHYPVVKKLLNERAEKRNIALKLRNDDHYS